MRKNILFIGGSTEGITSGEDGTRTHDLLTASQVL